MFDDTHPFTSRAVSFNMSTAYLYAYVHIRTEKAAYIKYVRAMAESILIVTSALPLDWCAKADDACTVTFIFAMAVFIACDNSAESLSPVISITRIAPCCGIRSRMAATISSIAGITLFSFLSFVNLTYTRESGFRDLPFPEVATTVSACRLLLGYEAASCPTVLKSQHATVPGVVRWMRSRRSPSDFLGCVNAFIFPRAHGMQL